MASYNKVLLMGNLTRDPEVRYTPKGTAVADIGLAVNRVWNNEAGQKQEEVTYVDITLWGRQAETAQQYLSKGRPLFVEGRLHMDTWEDKQTGQKRSKLKIVAESFQFIGARDGNSENETPRRNAPAKQQSHQRPQAAQPADMDDAPIADDDIPF